MVALPAVVDGVPLGSDGEPLKPWHEWDEAERCPVGRDPRKVTAEEYAAWNIEARPLLAVIRQNCIECSGGSTAEVMRCPSAQCPFWPYRMGTNPLRSRSLSDEQRQAMAERGRQLAAKQARGVRRVDKDRSFWTPRHRVGVRGADDALAACYQACGGGHGQRW